MAVYTRGATGHININILHSGSRLQHVGDTRNHGLWDPSVYVVSGGPMYSIAILTRHIQRGSLRTCIACMARSNTHVSAIISVNSPSLLICVERSMMSLPCPGAPNSPKYVLRAQHRYYLHALSLSVIFPLQIQIAQSM